MGSNAADSVKMAPKDTADAFLRQYYLILNRCPENTHKFYQETSFISWPEAEGGDMIPVTTLKGINDKVMASDYKHCSIEILTVDAQESYGGGVLVYVTGSLTTQEGTKKNFNQIFFLAQQPSGFYVFNDILHSADSAVPVSDILPNDEKKKDGAEASSENLEKNDVPKISAAPEEPKSPGSSFPPIKGNDSSVETVKPVAVVEVEAPKISYASVVAKMAPVASPKASVARKQPTSSKPNNNGPPKASAKEATASKMAKNASSATPSANAEAKSLIYIGGLPHDVTKEGVADVVKVFGPIKKRDNAIHIKRHEDGFCCGFVDFESADAAQRAADAHHVMFGEKQAYITLKKSPSNRTGNNESKGISSPKGGPGNENVRARDDTERARW